ncbi:molybdopterin-dependent oxidoreductase [Halococcus sp. AFM35]|uniref:molybdopterin-dependent oxidoreductase n=1 Tax=Halococcus sp. AFM35 TaxID=3421653 RepID=UPI003EB9C629
MRHASTNDSFAPALVTAVLAGIAGVAGSYALAGYTQGFVVAPIAGFLTQAMPDAVLRFAIVTLTDIGQQFGIDHLGQRANLLLAITLGTVLFASLVLAALVTGRQLDRRFAPIGLAGGLVWLATALLTGAPVTALGAGVASAFVVAVAVLAVAAGDTTDTDTSVSSGRREVLGSLASAVGVGVIGYLLGTRSSSTQSAASADTSGNTSAAGDATGNVPGGNSGPTAGDGANVATVKQYLNEAERRSFDIDGLEGLVSGEDFYEVDIQNINPQVNAADWSLSITGAVENEIELSYDDITSMQREFRFATLRCVSDPLNGKKMDNDLWTGVPMQRLLEQANPQGKFVMLRSVDNYYEEMEVTTLRDGFLTYGKNGGPLPREHGNPVRAVIGGHWGEISVKWLNEIEVLEGPQKGFWEKRGWHGTGPVNTVAKLHAVNHLDNGRIQVAGHTYAGARGIRRVEVSTDGGQTWNEAKLTKPLPAGTSRRKEAKSAQNAWQQWKYTYEPPNGKHQVVVRAVDGTGDLQPKDNKQSPYPNGAAGWVSKTING